jgi:peptidoglycan/LPS O-acetylase OafA/YrhL
VPFLKKLFAEAHWSTSLTFTSTFLPSRPPLGRTPNSAMDSKFGASNDRAVVLTALRGVCATGVVLHHLLLASSGAWKVPLHAALYYTPLEALFSGGKFVRIFFFISGFVLFLAHATGKPWSAAEFYVRRGACIWLPFAAASVIAVGVQLLWAGAGPVEGLSNWFVVEAQAQSVTPTVWASHLALAGSAHSTAINCVTWSLVQEARFIVVFPLLAAAVARYDLGTLAAMIGFSMAADSGYRAAGEMGNFITAETWAGALFSTLHFLPFFVVGMVVAKRYDLLLAAVTRLGAIGVCAAWIAAFLLVRRSDCIAASAGTAMVVMLLLSTPHVRAWASVRPLQWLGRVSYSLYLIHIPIIICVGHMLSGAVPEPVWLCSALAASFLAAGAFDRLITRPLIAVSRSIATGLFKCNGARLPSAPLQWTSV